MVGWILFALLLGIILGVTYMASSRASDDESLRKRGICPECGGQLIKVVPPAPLGGFVEPRD